MHKDFINKLICFYCVTIYEEDPNKKLELFILEENEEQTRIIEGCFYCPECGRYYPIDDTILFMQPDHMRKPEFDRGFLLNHKDKLPARIVSSGLPHNLENIPPANNEE